jgi:hypothetical protein
MEVQQMASPGPKSQHAVSTLKSCNFAEQLVDLFSDLSSAPHPNPHPDPQGALRPQNN